MLRARSIIEARQFAELQPCEGCGRDGVAPPFTIEARGEALTVTSSDYCAACGTLRRFELLLADERVPPGAWGNAEPSTIIDAGQWLALADRLLPSDLSRARDALAEMLKFIPADAREVPRSAFFTSEGRRMYASDPVRFGRERITMTIRAYEDLLARNGTLRKS